MVDILIADGAGPVFSFGDLAVGLATATPVVPAAGGRSSMGSPIEIVAGTGAGAATGGSLVGIAVTIGAAGRLGSSAETQSRPPR